MILEQLQWKRGFFGTRTFREELRSDLSLYRSGARDFHAVNRNYHITPAYPETPIGCIRERVELERRALTGQSE